MTIKRIAAGHYVGPRGEIRNIKSSSGAQHTRGAAVWLVTKADGRTELVRSLDVAKQMIGPLRAQLCTPMTVGQAAIAAASVL